MYLLNESALAFESKLVKEIANGTKKQRLNISAIVKNELFFFESRIKVWCVNEEDYLNRWMAFLSECGCKSVSCDYMKRLISQVASEKGLKRTDFKYRGVIVYE